MEKFPKFGKYLADKMERIVVIWGLIVYLCMFFSVIFTAVYFSHVTPVEKADCFVLIFLCLMSVATIFMLILPFVIATIKYIKAKRAFKKRQELQKIISCFNWCHNEYFEQAVREEVKKAKYWTFNELLGQLFNPAAGAYR